MIRNKSADFTRVYALTKVVCTDLTIKNHYFYKITPPADISSEIRAETALSNHRLTVIIL